MEAVKHFVCMIRKWAGHWCIDTTNRFLMAKIELMWSACWALFTGTYRNKETNIINSPCVVRQQCVVALFHNCKRNLARSLGLLAEDRWCLLRGSYYTTAQGYCYYGIAPNYYKIMFCCSRKWIFPIVLYIFPAPKLLWNLNWLDHCWLLYQ